MKQVVEKSVEKPARRPGTGVAKLLLATAVVGVGAGVALSYSRAPDQEPEQLAEAVTRDIMPTGASATEPIDMMAPDPRSLQGLPAYPRAVPRRLTSGTTAENGVGAIAWFETSDSLDAVLGFYEQAFAQQNMSATSRRYGTRRGSVAWLQHIYDDAGLPAVGEGLLHMVSASDEGGRTMVFLSATEPQHMFDRAQVLPGGLRLPDGARPQVVRTGEVGQEHATIFASYRVSANELLKRVEKIHHDDGWAFSEKAVSPEGKTSLVVRRGEFVQVASVEGGETSAQVLVTIEQEPGASRE